MSDTTPDAELKALRAGSFGRRASAYARHRPDYPWAAVEWGLAEIAHPPREILDLAAGTGKLTATLLHTGAEVTAVEPDAEMLAQLRVALPAVPALAGRAEDIPLPDACVDAVFAGQALHWFDLEVALTEIGRVLRPGGVLVALWNHEDHAIGWVAEFSALTRTGASRDWRDPVALPEYPAFRPAEQAFFPHAQRRTADTLLETIATHSHLLVATEEERTRKLRAAREFLAARPETATGEFDLPLVTTALRARRAC
ncbi:class I SAM-dependent methyltransferase [Amycolatopsis aidingensis]|uniref:class I SAM-dependent methyltransferase n=1 Tax=Amycolatopsis aidingensis TaxID=2842453 RepID=UPI001C0E08C1|nr:class I SAM-dependent methyltransferase [Amycolatopsis aidingensis]